MAEITPIEAGKRANEYTVYRHVFPNSKSYVGISRDVEKRWQSNGLLYKSQKKIAHAIAKYGWDNISHEILLTGLTRGQACAAEQHFIQAYDSIVNGYNVSIGGDVPTGTYLNAHVLAMIRAKKYFFPDVAVGVVELADSDRKDKTAAEFWNEADRAVTMKHGSFSATDENGVGVYWFHIGQYFKLWVMMEMGLDVSGWREQDWECAVYEYLFGTATPPSEGV